MILSRTDASVGPVDIVRMSERDTLFVGARNATCTVSAVSEVPVESPVFMTHNISTQFPFSTNKLAKFDRFY